jgi:microcystin-dependent protein
MSIPTNTGNAVITYDGNGFTTVFDIPFTFASAAEIAVYLNGTVVAGVTVLGAGDPFGGTAIFATAPIGGTVVRIRRLQTLHVSDNDTTAHALIDKLVAGNGITLTEIDDGDDETLEIAVAGGLIPPGLVSPFAGSTAPVGWLFCDGAAISRTTYAALFAVIASTYGAGDGTTTFNLPDLRGRVAAGRDDMGGISANRLTAGSAAGLNGTVLGGAGGDQQHQLTVAQMPSHTHGLHAVNGAQGGTGANEPINTPGTDIKTTTSTGGDAAHNNVQPTLILNHIIKT